MILVLLPESHITMKLRLFLLASLCWNLSVGQTTFYSRNATSGGNWNDVNSWTLNSDGSGGPVVTVPARTDNIVVLTGHTITVTTADSNGSTGTSANAVYGSTGFTGSGTARFYQNGDITISTGGTLSVTDANGAMFEGNLIVNGTLSSSAGGSNDDLLIAGYFELTAIGTLNVGDDLILIDDCEAVLNNTSISSDDIYINGTGARIGSTAQ